MTPCFGLEVAYPQKATLVAYSHFMAEKTITVSDLTGDEIQQGQRLSLEYRVTRNMLYDQQVLRADLNIRFNGMLIGTIPVGPEGWALDFNLDDFAKVRKEKNEAYDRAFDDID